MIRTVLRRVLVGGVAAVLLAGCGTSEAGAAATVGDRRISVAEVQDATTDIQALYGPDQPVPQRSVLFLIAAAPYLEKITAQEGAGASLDDARKIFADKVGHPTHAALVAIQANASLGNLDQQGQDKATAALQQVTKELAADHFTVNPRYGVFNAERGSLLPQQLNWLPAPSATPAAQQ